MFAGLAVNVLASKIMNVVIFMDQPMAVMKYLTKIVSKRKVSWVVDSLNHLYRSNIYIEIIRAFIKSFDT